MNRIQTVLGSAAVASLFIIMPFAASADTVNASSSTGVVVSPNGIVRVIGAEVTSVSNGVFNAFTTIGNTVMTWVVNVSDSTKIGANGSKDATTTDIKVGDKVGFTGALSSSAGNLLTVAATKVRDITNFPPRHVDEEATSSTDASGTTTPGIVGKHSDSRGEGKNDNDNDGNSGKGNGNAGVNANASVSGNAKSDNSEGAHAGLNFLGGFHLGEDN